MFQLSPPVEDYDLYLQAKTTGGVESSIKVSLTVCGSEKLVRTNSDATISVYSEQMFTGLWNSYPLESMWKVEK